MVASKKVKLYTDNDNKETYIKDITIPKSGEVEIKMPWGGGFVIK